MSDRSKGAESNVKAALFDAALAVMIEHGPSKLSMREVARRAGVSHAAPYNHFANKEAMVVALAAEGYMRLDQSMTDALAIAEQTPDARLVAIGVGYLIFATRNPELYRLMHDTDMCERQSVVEAVEEAKSTGDKLAECVVQVRTKYEMSLEPMAVQIDCLALWGIVHGLADLMTNNLVDGVSGTDIELFRTVLKRAIGLYPHHP